MNYKKDSYIYPKDWYCFHCHCYNNRYNNRCSICGQSKKLVGKGRGRKVVFSIH